MACPQSYINPQTFLSESIICSSGFEIPKHRASGFQIRMSGGCRKAIFKFIVFQFIFFAGRKFIANDNESILVTTSLKRGQNGVGN